MLRRGSRRGRGVRVFGAHADPRLRSARSCACASRTCRRNPVAITWCARRRPSGLAVLPGCRAGREVQARTFMTWPRAFDVFARRTPRFWNRQPSLLNVQGATRPGGAHHHISTRRRRIVLTASTRAPRDSTQCRRERRAHRVVRRRTSSRERTVGRAALVDATTGRTRDRRGCRARCDGET